MAQRELRQSDLNHLYESTFLEASSRFEVFQEELFFGSVLGRSQINEAIPLLTFRNRSEAERVVLAGERRGFISWSNMDENIRRAEGFLSRGRPFSRLHRRGRDLQTLRTATAVRNAIAHESGAARERFRSLPLGALPAMKRTPAGFLRQAVGEGSQHQTLLDEYVRIAKALSASSDIQARRLLREEDPYSSGSKASRGTYECRDCGTRVRHTSGTRNLAPCDACHQGDCPRCGNSPRSVFLRVYGR